MQPHPRVDTRLHHICFCPTARSLFAGQKNRPHLFTLHRQIIKTMTTLPRQIKCSKVYSYQEFITIKEFDKQGVYIWGFMKDKVFLPYYVGKSESSIVKRIQKHWRNELVFGNHHILKKQYLDNFRKIIKPFAIVKNNFVKYEYHFAYLNLNDKGKAKNTKRKLSLTQTYIPNILPHIQNYQERFYVCCITDKQAKELEKHIQYLLKPLVGKNIKKDYSNIFEVVFPFEFSLQ